MCWLIPQATQHNWREKCKHKHEGSDKFVSVFICVDVLLVSDEAYDQLHLLHGSTNCCLQWTSPPWINYRSGEKYSVRFPKFPSCWVRFRAKVSCQIHFRFVQTEMWCLHFRFVTEKFRHWNRFSVRSCTIFGVSAYEYWINDKRCSIHEAGWYKQSKHLKTTEFAGSALHITTDRHGVLALYVEIMECYSLC